MRTMSDETEQRMCDEDFGSDEEGEEADVESYLEDNSSELMDRLRELEAENSALILANESQREAYERCLDEVANHVVQALLNQKDLREECIKLKMLVFDLERQNRALCELFQQKLPNHPAAHYQVHAGPPPEYNAPPHNDSAKQVEPAQTEAQAKGNGYRTQHASPGPRGPAASMEALSPFFKKKAHILEVLRKMEETDPLKFHPSTASLSFCDYSQVLMSTEAVLATADPLPLQCKSLHTHCRCSCSDADAHPHVNGDGAVKCEGGNTCCLHCKRSTDTPPKPCNHVCTPPKASSAPQSHVVPAAAASECYSKSVPPSKQCTKNEAHQQPAGAAAHSSAPEAADPSVEVLGAEQEDHSAESCLPAPEELTGFCPTTHLPTSVKEISHCDMEISDGVPNGLALSFINNNTSEPSAVAETDGMDPEASSVRAGASVSPSPSCLSEVKAAAINSPSKLLKFLKIPSIGEKSQPSPAAVRLSPQLTRNSRIPCRTNNYEVYHSPVPTRRATTTERCRQPPPPPSRSESYPATHSAPTSPPQPEDVCSSPAKEISYSSFSAPKASANSKMSVPSSTSSSSPKVSQRVPHYENVCDMSTNSREEEPTQGLEKRTTLPSQAKANGSERKLVKSLPESAMNPPPQRKQSSSSTSESTSDDEEDSDSPVWVNHHSLPNTSALGKPQGRANYSRAREKLQPDIREVPVPSSEVAKPPPPPPPARRSDSSSIPKRPAPGAVRSQADSSHHAFKDRLAALGKLRSSEDLQVGLHPVDPASDASFGEERSKTVERPLEQLKEEQRHSKYTESPDIKPKAVGVGLKYPGSSQLYDQAMKSQSSAPAVVKQELCVMKAEGPKSRIGLPSPNADAPQVLRNNIKCPGSLNLAYNVKPGPHSNSSPNKIPPKSPSKPCPAPSVHRGAKPPEAPRYSSKSEERTKISGKGKKNPMFGDSLPPPPPRPPTSEGEKPVPPVPCPQSAIEQKVMKGIEENLLKLQEQDRGGQTVEVKQKASNGIASWFGLKKSKLPALSRKADGTKAKDEKREWKITIPSVSRDSVKIASRCKEGVEGLNISTLMEKAEGLRRALEEERAYVERSGRGHSCEVVMDPTQGQLAVMYRGARSDNFMQQLLNRVDGKEVISVPQRRLSFDCKTSKPVFAQQSDVISRDDMEKGSERIGKITSDDNLADHSQHFAGSGASTYTLDSGIGTFPLPDCSSGAAGRSLSKTRAGAEHHSSGSPGRAGRRARTLDRELPSQDECYTPHKQLIPTIQYGSVLEGRSSAGVLREDKETHAANMFSPRSKTWTFPNLKTPAGPADVYLAVEEEEEEAVTFASQFRASVKAGGPSPSRAVDPCSLPVPAQSGMSRRGKTRTPSVPEMSRDGGLELLRERPEEALSPSRPQVLETPESLSDSLYDSLSSCGSQG
ncbi:nck-associated protein 5-like [Hippoglossus stenolepis]|uniref:nck-associated protein 5-like n=1 Tax=Hippoglossus stenolepis TaxID=195615 RepID=UPI00159C2E06|nr:nck-associated protein 5-like [Hippoglossus stenolepis]XP_035014718.1 nck-associated protein 5-like [Hippoglossus stenolepis]XP_035014719.1 nck-associated protein 5-like [Hippoglossus stenolepis]XP_035014720.1 nck-associated protein 5-like [Hippoglossus stenolepis]XP_035014721.1 nck-associated protein 5-like [Hippoglossus stenolepis]XP_035014722.1 nck-associated protein 5-like [Hippoglossus stenolepis]XP_035014723.1 nck-associated protein 5-like [Hippoglossus stenolepis]